MKKLIMSFVMLMTTAAVAQTYTFIVPQKPGGGTSIWASIVGKEMEKYLDGDKIKIKHIPGGREIPGFNKWATELKEDPTYFMVSHGGNGVAFLQENVKYNYADYDSVGLMSLNIISAIRKDADPENISFAAGAGRVPEALGLALLYCGPNKTTDEYGQCFKDHVKWVKGVKNSENRLAFRRGEMTVSRENPAAYKKHLAPDEGAKIFFHHGILQPDGSHIDDINYPGYQMEILFEKKYGVKPSGEFYDAYKLVKSFRDGLQKAIWASKGNPNTEKLRAALTQVATNPESVKIIQDKVGVYGWFIGEQGNKQVDTLMGFVTEPALKNLVKFNRETLGLASEYKPQLVK